MSTLRMTPYERNERSLARSYGKLTREYVELTRPWNRAGERFIDAAYDHARQAGRHAQRSIDAHERRSAGNKCKAGR
jgi:hypothetical protein